MKDPTALRSEIQNFIVYIVRCLKNTGGTQSFLKHLMSCASAPLPTTNTIQYSHLTCPELLALKLVEAKLRPGIYMETNPWECLMGKNCGTKQFSSQLNCYKVHAYQRVQTPPLYHEKPLSNRSIECKMKRTKITHTPPFVFLAPLALCIAGRRMAKRPKAPFQGERS